MPHFFPFEDLGFRCNPFRALADEEWAAVAIVPPSILKADAPYIQILGEQGRGKSTTLRGLAAYLQLESQRVMYEYLPLGQRRFITSIADLDVFLLDEAQRLWWWERRRLVRSTMKYDTRLVFSSHEDLTELFGRFRLSVFTIWLDQVDEDRLAAILQRRLAYFALHDPPSVVFSPDAIQYLFAQFGSDLRQMEYFLYEVFQRLETFELLTVAYLANVRAVLE